MTGPEPSALSDVLFPHRDVRFQTLVRTLSERETGPHADNLISNEDSFPRVAGALERSAVRDTVYLGVGPDQNFTYLARVRPRLAFIVDFRRRNLLLHLVHKALFELSEDRVAYLSRLLARRPGRLPAGATATDLVQAFRAAAFDREALQRAIDDVARVLGPLGVVSETEWDAVSTIQSKLAGPGMNARFLALPMYPTFGRLVEMPDRDGHPAHLLAREEDYQTVRALHLGDRVIPLVGDFGGGRVLQALGDWLRTHSLKLSTFYISDVEFFLFRSGRFPFYVEGLARLPWASGALIVRSSTREIAHAERVAGDSSTTIIRRVDEFLDAVQAGRIRSVDDLFTNETGFRATK